MRARRVELRRQFRQFARRRHRVQPVDDEGNGPGQEEGVPDQCVLVAAVVVEPDAEDDDQGEVQVEVDDVHRLRQRLPVLDQSFMLSSQKMPSERWASMTSRACQ